LKLKKFFHGQHLVEARCRFKNPAASRRNWLG